MEVTSKQTAAKTFMPTTNKSVLVYGEYKGFQLPQGKSYRPTNLDKTNSILALAIQNKQNAFLFEVYEYMSMQKITDAFKQIDPTFKYLKLVLDSHIQLLLFTRLDEEQTVTIIWNNVDEYGLKNSIIDVEKNAVEVASVAYSLAEHYLVPKHAKKAKQYAGSDLTQDEKDFSVIFEVKPTIVRPS